MAATSSISSTTPLATTTTGSPPSITSVIASSRWWPRCRAIRRRGSSRAWTTFARAGTRQRSPTFSRGKRRASWGARWPTASRSKASSSAWPPAGAEARLCERRGLEDFFEGREALRDLGSTGDAQRPHAVLVGHLRERHDVDLLTDEMLDVARHLQDLVDADAPLVARVAALEATDRAIDRLRRRRLEGCDDAFPKAVLLVAREGHLFLAVRAKRAHQAL